MLGQTRDMMEAHGKAGRALGTTCDEHDYHVCLGKSVFSCVKVFSEMIRYVYYSLWPPPGSLPGRLPVAIIYPSLHFWLLMLAS
jgi:hypothetical protein